MNNHYDTLGLSKQATKTEIKQAYMNLALKYHPDRNRDEGATERFRLINQAYEVLYNEQSKQEYDGQITSFVSGNTHETAPFAQFVPFFQMFKTAVHQFNQPMPIVLKKSLTIHQMYNGLNNCPIIIKRFIINGDVKEEEEELLYISFKQGIDSGEVFIVEGKGNCVNGIYGNIKIIIELEPNDDLMLFKRQGMDIIVNHTLSLKEALCGCRFSVKHPSGKPLSISTFGLIIHPNATQVIERWGFMRDGSVGNLILIFNVEFPKELKKESLELLDKAL